MVGVGQDKNTKAKEMFVESRKLMLRQAFLKEVSLELLEFTHRAKIAPAMETEH